MNCNFIHLNLYTGYFKDEKELISVSKVAIDKICTVDDVKDENSDYESVICLVDGSQRDCAESVSEISEKINKAAQEAMRGLVESMK